MRISTADAEEGAFWVVWICVLVVIVSVAVGVLATPATGAVVFVVLALAVTAWLVTHRAPDRSLRDAELRGHAADDGAHPRRMLLVAGEALNDRALDDAIGAGDTGNLTIDVLAPVLQSRTHFVTTDIDAEVIAARGRLDTTLACARRHGLRASGEVGDPVDPRAGLRNELMRYDVNEVVVATHPDGDENWLEPALLDQLRAQLGVPVRRVVVER